VKKVNFHAGSERVRELWTTGDENQERKLKLNAVLSDPMVTVTSSSFICLENK